MAANSLDTFMAGSYDRMAADKTKLRTEKEWAEQQRDHLLGVISAHEAEKAHGATANMDHADAELYAAAEQVEKEKADAR